jgi:hypothetical protein
MTKRHSYARRQMQITFRTYLAANWRPLILLALVLSAATLPVYFTDHRWQQGFMTGVMATAFLSLTVLGFALHTEGLQQLAGAWGEDNTCAELDKARKRGHIWGAVHNIEFGGFGDIDHVVLTPGGVLALETKWKFRELARNWLHKDLRQASSAAGKTRSVLRSKGIDAVHDVTPVVVVWGKGGHEIADGGEVVDGVHLVYGGELADWMARWGTGRLAQDNAEPVLAKLETFAKARAGR